VDKLPPDLQEQVLRYVSALGTATPNGQSGASLRQFAGYLDQGAARDMAEAIEEGCERVDAIEW
jgi:hypothetical protein